MGSPRPEEARLAICAAYTMEQNSAMRAQSLQLLKSKLRSNGRSRLRSSHRVAATFEELTPNQQEAVKPPEQVVANASQLKQGTMQRKLSLRSSEPAQEFKVSAAVTSTSCNQDEISVAELRHEFYEIKVKTSKPNLHRANERVTPPSFPVELKSYTKKVIRWSCDECKRECIPVREESRCLCGHRYKEHPSSVEDPRVKSSAGFRAFACASLKCSCKAFFYVVAEGAWILRCRCKHKHTDHDPASTPFVCKKAKCGCQGFDSPWVCNCNHPWSSHRQHRVDKRFDALQLLQAQFSAPELNAVHRTDLVTSPLDLRL